MPCLALLCLSLSFNFSEAAWVRLGSGGVFGNLFSRRPLWHTHSHTHTRAYAHTGQTLTSHACSYCPVFIVVMSMPTSENMSAVTESSTSTQIRVRVRIQVWSGIWRACHLPVIYSWILSANHCALCINLAQETRRGTPVGHFECSLKSPRIQFDVTLLRFPWGISIELNITWNYDYIIYILSYIIHSLFLHSISRTLFVSNYR